MGAWALPTPEENRKKLTSKTVGASVERKSMMHPRFWLKCALASRKTPRDRASPTHIGLETGDLRRVAGHPEKMPFLTVTRNKTALSVWLCRHSAGLPAGSLRRIGRRQQGTARRAATEDSLLLGSDKPVATVSDFLAVSPFFDAR